MWRDVLHFLIRTGELAVSSDCRTRRERVQAAKPLTFAPGPQRRSFKLKM